MTQSTAVAQIRKTSLVEKFASRYSIDPDKLLTVLKSTAFKQRDGEVTNEQMAALLVVADQYGLNPFTREIYAFPDKNNGIVPVVGVDGWSRIMNQHPEYDGIEFRASENIIEMRDAKPCPEWMECVIYRKDRKHPTPVREYLDEVYRPPFEGKGRDGKPYKVFGPWQTHTKRFLRHKTLIQGNRIAFGFVGIYDEDEAERIITGQVIDAEPIDQTTQDLNESLSKAAKTGDGISRKEDFDMQPDTAQEENTDIDDWYEEETA